MHGFWDYDILSYSSYELQLWLSNDICHACLLRRSICIRAEVRTFIHLDYKIHYFCFTCQNVDNSMLIPTVPLWASETDSSLVKFLEQDIFSDLVIFSLWPKIITFEYNTYLYRKFNADSNETITNFWIRFFTDEILGTRIFDLFFHWQRSYRLKCTFRCTFKVQGNREDSDKGRAVLRFNPTQRLTF